jgi:hypothetical protein
LRLVALATAGPTARPRRTDEAVTLGMAVDVVVVVVVVY